MKPTETLVLRFAHTTTTAKVILRHVYWSVHSKKTQSKYRIEMPLRVASTRPRPNVRDPLGSTMVTSYRKPTSCSNTLKVEESLT